jgi:hypothetical protein
MEKKMSMIKEEMLAYDSPLDARIHQVKAPPETDRELAADAEMLYAAGTGVFSSYEEAEYFSMLPLTVADRVAVLARTRELQQIHEKQKAAWLSHETQETLQKKEKKMCVCE